ncbi:glutamate--cysteine ligase [Frankia sp. AiPs1]|uniref:glutamate--cysteine ligase n=1 Tax=Frankia sp. AiPs1 TaxID=573493 RepID=UPI00204406CF|nr:glutamate--cysteine ligase [Frankia sp. AiPs1]MCM3923043.1 glutamate--cysteine ligase [Frankia sp. AiPs1]
MTTRAVRTVGVEEEFLLVDPERHAVRAAASRVLARGDRDRAGPPPGDGDLDVELTREQVESGSTPHTSLAGLRGSLVELRRAASRAAEAEGVALAATATCPTPTRPTITPRPRYQQIREEFGLTAREQLTCGCHVHVAVHSRQEAVGALDRLRPWLSVLVAMTANSPFWQGVDSGYASYRTQVWQRWPTAGATGAFGSPEEYDRVVDLLIRTGAAMDDGMIYFDVRLSHHYPTLELRVADVCLSVDDSVLLAALARALVSTAARQWAAGEPAPPCSPSCAALRSVGGCCCSGPSCAAWAPSRSTSRRGTAWPRRCGCSPGPSGGRPVRCTPCCCTRRSGSGWWTACAGAGMRRPASTASARPASAVRVTSTVRVISTVWVTSAGSRSPPPCAPGRRAGCRFGSSTG